MNLQKGIQINFNCWFCNSLAQDAFQTKCCGYLLCSKCYQVIKRQKNKCLSCGLQQLQVKPSTIGRRIIGGMKAQCGNGCRQNLLNSQKQKHSLICPNRRITCKICSRKYQLKNILNHMNQQHMNELVKFLCQQIEEKQEKENKSQSQNLNICQRKIFNSNGDFAEFGKSGKYYCGKKTLIGKCTCCDERCGPKTGENCNACMELDWKRFKLAKGFLINPVGAICKGTQSGKYYCGRKKGKFYCSQKNQCSECERVTKSVGELGRYKNLL